MKSCLEAGVVVKGPVVHKNKDYVTSTFLMKKIFMDVKSCGVCMEGVESYCVMMPGIDFADIKSELIVGDFVLVRGYLNEVKEIDQDRKTTVDDYIIADHVQIIGPLE